MTERQPHAGTPLAEITLYRDEGHLLPLRHWEEMLGTITGMW